MRSQLFVAARDAVSPDDAGIFRANGSALYRFYCALLLIPSLPPIAFMAIHCILHGNSLLHCLPVLATLGVGILVGFLFTKWIEVTYPTQVTAPGIIAYDFWGRKATLSWGEIETVEPIRFMGFPYLKVHSFRKERQILWLPLFLRSPEGFRAAIVHHASPKHPLRRHLEEESQPDYIPLPH